MRTLLKAIAAAAPFAAAALFASDAGATTVQYNTNSSQLCVGASGCGVATQTIGGASGVTITFTPASATVNANPTTFGSFGVITISCVGGGTGCGSQSLAGLNLFINISQLLPGAGNGSIPGGVITGTVSGTASSAVITWPSLNSVVIGGIIYSIANNPLALVPPSVDTGSGFGRTSIQAIISEVPVPAALPLMFAGIAGLSFARKKKQAA